MAEQNNNQKKETLSPQQQESKSAFDSAIKGQKELTTSIDPTQKVGDVQKEPLGAEAKDAPAASNPRQQEGANRAIEGARSNLFGDTTSARGSETTRETPNIDGMHGRDGGFSNGTPNNPAADEATVKPEVAAEQRAAEDARNDTDTARR